MNRAIVKCFINCKTLFQTKIGYTLHRGKKMQRFEHSSQSLARERFSVIYHLVWSPILETIQGTLILHPSDHLPMFITFSRMLGFHIEEKLF